MVAVEARHVEMVELLLASGADPHHRSSVDGMHALHVLAEQSQRDHFCPVPAPLLLRSTSCGSFALKRFGTRREGRRETAASPARGGRRSQHAHHIQRRGTRCAATRLLVCQLNGLQPALTHCLR
jgi:hypothetical protein